MGNFGISQGGESMTGEKFYLQAKLNGMRRFSGISVFGAQYSQNNHEGSPLF